MNWKRPAGTLVLVIAVAIFAGVCWYGFQTTIIRKYHAGNWYDGHGRLLTMAPALVRISIGYDLWPGWMQSGKDILVGVVGLWSCVVATAISRSLMEDKTTEGSPTDVPPRVP